MNNDDKLFSFIESFLQTEQKFQVFKGVPYGSRLKRPMEYYLKQVCNGNDNIVAEKKKAMIDIIKSMEDMGDSVLLYSILSLSLNDLKNLENTIGPNSTFILDYNLMLALCEYKKIEDEEFIPVIEALEDQGWENYKQVTFHFPERQKLIASMALFTKLTHEFISTNVRGAYSINAQNYPNMLINYMKILTYIFLDKNYS